MHVKRFFAITGLLTAWLVAAAGCELIASIDRSKIGEGGAGGNGGSTSSSGGSGGGPACKVAMDCPGTDDECQKRTCDNGVCGTSFTPDGTAVTAQTAGDCKQDVCDGAGAVKTINDDVDLPDDNNPCTDDVCANGSASNPNVMAGVSCGQDLVCDGSGLCVGCTDPLQCPGTDDDCKARTCVNNTCGVDFQPSGTAVSTQMAGDCKVDVCDGAGNTMTVDDNMDLPVDNKECTQDLCTSGMPSNPDESAGFGCAENGGSVCDGMGVCVECTLPSHCPGVDNECQTRTCVNNACGFTFQPSGSDGVPALPQTSGACKKEVCNGAGGVTTVNNDTELPDDSNPCTNDLCTTGVPSHTNVNSGVSCGGNNQVCNGNGQCVGCVQASDCSGVDNECQVRTCINSICGFTFQNNGSLGNPLLPQTPGNCKQNVCDGAGGTIVQNDNTDLPVDGNQCSQDLCTNGSPSNPPSTSGTSCNQGGTVCDGLGACVACNVAADCPGIDNSCQTRTCVNHICGFNFQPNGGAGSPLLAQTSKDCKKNVCDGAGNAIVINDGADLPVDNNECTGDVCTSGTPSNPNLPAGTMCTGGVCNGSGTCGQCNVPADCPGSDTSCQARTCINNMCGVSFQPNGSLGSPLLAQTSGDCKKNVCNGAGGTIVQNDNADVPPNDNNECTQDICNNGVPYVNVANGTPTSMQTAGDCKKNVCNGAGGTASINDDVDLPVDGNDCTNDVCTNGAPSNPNLASGTPCSGGVCNGSGLCGQCNVPADCSGSDTSCQARTCINNMCGVSFQPVNSLGSPLLAQTPGDCKQTVCNGAGGTTVQNDNADVPPNDNNECTQDICNNGTPYVNVANGTPVSSQTPGDCKQTVCNGAGGTTVQNDNTDVPPNDNNECTQDICNNGTPYVNVANGTPVSSQTPGDCKKNVCNGAGGTTVQNDNTDVPPNDANECTQDICNNGTPYVNVANGTPVSSQTPGDCKKNVCNGAGSTIIVNDDTDSPPNDANECTQDICNNGTPYVNVANGTPVSSQTPGDCKKNVCNGAGGTIIVNDDTDSPPNDANECTQDICNNGVPYVPVAPGTPVSSQTPGDCKLNVCNGAGGTTAQNDDTDVPPNDSNECTQDICNNGVPYVPVANGTPTSAQTPMDCLLHVCNGAGGTTDVPDDTDVHDDGNECTQNLCSNGMMQHPPEPLGTPIAAQTPNDCMINVCDGAGGTTVQNSDGDVPLDDGNQCTNEICTAGVGSHPNAVIGSGCSTNGNTCDGAGACIRTFMVVRVGDGSAALTSAATATFVEERKVSDGSLFGVAGNPIAMPTAVVAPNNRLTNSGTATSEGNLSRSLDAKYVVLAGYDAATGTANINTSTSATANRSIGRIGRTAGAYVVDTSTKFSSAFGGGNPRSACTADGTTLWASGSGAGGMWTTTLGSTGAGTQLFSAPAAARFCHVFFNQLYGTSGTASFVTVFKVGSGLPTTSPQTPAVLAGLTNSGNSPYSFVFFDTNNDSVPDLLYIADDRNTAATGGIYKWTSADGVNWVAGTPALTNVGATNGARGLTGYLSGGVVTLIASTISNTLSLATDPLTGAAMTVNNAYVGAPTNAAFRGVALGVQ